MGIRFFEFWVGFFKDRSKDFYGFMTDHFFGGTCFLALVRRGFLQYIFGIEQTIQGGISGEMCFFF